MFLARVLVACALTAAALGRHSVMRGSTLLPKWTPTWDMQQSTIVQPCNDSGLLDPDFYSQFGVVDIDWSNAKQLWVVPPMMCEELLLTQAAVLKAKNPNIKVFVYRNLVKALPWYSSVRTKIGDPAYADWFLKFGANLTYHVPQCDNNYNPPKCTDFYHDQDQTPEYPHGDGSCPGPCDCGPVPCGEYLWDHRAGTPLRDWMINEWLLGPTGLGNANVSGFYFDDGWANVSQAIAPWEPKEGFCDHSPIGGATEEDYYCTADMGLTQADTTLITDNHAQTMDAVQEAVVAAGGWGWQFFTGFSTPDNKTCAATLSKICSAGTNSPYYNVALQHGFTKNANGSPVPLPSFNEDLATFLLVRGPFAWLGYGWVGCGVPYDFPDALKADYGVPQGTCSETAPGSGVFTRVYSKAVAQMDCSTWTGTVKVTAE